MTNEEIFAQKTGMSVDDAWQKVQLWQQNGETEKVSQGIQMILQFFPDHPAKNFLIQSAEKNVFSAPSSENSVSETHSEKNSEIKTEAVEENAESENPPAKKNMTISETFQFILTGKKPIRMEKISSDCPEKVKPKIASPKEEKPKISSEKIMQMSGVSFDQAKNLDASLPDENEVLDDERMFAAISYIPFLSFFTLFTRKDSPFIQFHAWQAFSLLVIFLGSLFPYFLLHWISLFSFLFWFFYLFFFGVLALCFATAWKGRYISLPFVSDFARRFAGKKPE